MDTDEFHTRIPPYAHFVVLPACRVGHRTALSVEWLPELPVQFAYQQSHLPQGRLIVLRKFDQPVLTERKVQVLIGKIRRTRREKKCFAGWSLRHLVAK